MIEGKWIVHPTDCTYKFYKICHVVDALTSKFNQTMAGEKRSIDEQVVPFK